MHSGIRDRDWSVNLDEGKEEEEGHLFTVDEGGDHGVLEVGDVFADHGGGQDVAVDPGDVIRVTRYGPHPAPRAPDGLHTVTVLLYC